MQHDLILKKKVEFDLFLLAPIPMIGEGWGCLRAKYLLPCCCIRDSLYFDMQHDCVLKKFNFDVLTPGTKTQTFDRKSPLIFFLVFIVPLHAKFP